MQKCRLQKVEEVTLKNSLTSGKNDGVYKIRRKRTGPYSEIYTAAHRVKMTHLRGILNLNNGD